MHNKILIINNGYAKKHTSPIIDSFLKLDGYNVRLVNNHFKDNLTFWQKVFYKLRLPIDFNRFNFRILIAVKEFLPELIIIIKGNDVYTSTIKKAKKLSPNSKIISWSGDNMLKSHNSSYYFINSIPLYDIHFTTKSNIVRNFYEIGAKNVVFLNKAYSKTNHYPDFNYNLKFDVLFIGTYENDRYHFLRYLSNNGIKIDVFGNDWNKIRSTKNLIVHNKPLEGHMYRQAISSSKISLCFLRKSNDDIQTSRSIEIPACKGFMIAERTVEHQKLFKENIEAVYFDSEKELLEKVKFYLQNDNLRQMIAERGYKRVIESDYSYENMIKIILNKSF